MYTLSEAGSIMKGICAAFQTENVALSIKNTSTARGQSL